MLDKVEFKRGIGAYWRALNKKLASGVALRQGEIPDYQHGEIPEICKKAKMGGGLGARCREFYSTATTEVKCVVCPFGITVQFSRMPCAHHEVTASVILGRETADEPRVVADLRRHDREHARSAFAEDRRVGLAAEIPVSRFHDFVRFSECLSYGELALPIRGYAHELLTPIQGLLNDLSALGSKVGHVYDSLVFNARHISRLAKKIQVIISGELTVNEGSLRKVTLYKMVGDICKRYIEGARYRNIAIEVGYDAGAVKYVGFTPDLLELTLSCLIENAIKYSFDGFDDKLNTVSIDFLMEEGKKVVKITNFGCYIEPDELETGSIFELGKRGVNSGDMRRKGTGNGLYIVRQILTAHKGTVSIRSALVPSTNAEPFAQTTVEIKMPIYPEFGIVNSNRGRLSNSVL